MKEQFIVCGYNITTSPQFQNKRFGVIPELDKQLGTLALECQNKKNKRMIDQLTQLIIKYPSVPMLKNYLSVAYNVQGNRKKAMEINNWILTEHPDYLFAKINLAHSSIEQGELGKVTEVLGESMEIKQLYPERDLFHLSEITGFYHVAIRYFAAIDNLELAENRLEILKEIAPEHPDTEIAETYLFALRLKSATKRWEEENKQRITPSILNSVPRVSSNEAPHFHHPEIENLYHYGLKIPREKLKEILSLPRQTVIPDLEKVLRDSVTRYGYFAELEYDEETHSFLLHALFLLKDLNAIESLPMILALLASDYDFLEFWLGDHKTATIWQCLYSLGLDNPKVYQAFLMKPGIDTFSKTAVSEALCQMVLHHPETQEEIVSIYTEVFTLFSEAAFEDNLLDSDFLGLAISDTIDCRLNELLPIIRALYEKEYVALGINGDFKTVEKEFSRPPKYNHQRNIYNIFELYDDILNTWSGYNENKNDHFRALPQFKPAVSKKIGRNDDCPCGSGLKYKKCCGK